MGLENVLKKVLHNILKIGNNTSVEINGDIEELKQNAEDANEYAEEVVEKIEDEYEDSIPKDWQHVKTYCEELIKITNYLTKTEVKTYQESIDSSLLKTYDKQIQKLSKELEEVQINLIKLGFGESPQTHLDELARYSNIITKFINTGLKHIEFEEEILEKAEKVRRKILENHKTTTHGESKNFRYYKIDEEDIGAIQVSDHIDTTYTDGVYKYTKGTRKGIFNNLHKDDTLSCEHYNVLFEGKNGADQINVHVIPSNNWDEFENEVLG